VTAELTITRRITTASNATFLGTIGDIVADVASFPIGHYPGCARHAKIPEAGCHPGGTMLRITDMSKDDKQNLRYCDFYCFMSLADFSTWVEAEDLAEPEISYK